MALDMENKIGSLPVWAWGVIVAGVVFVGYMFMRQGGGPAPTTSSSNLDPNGYQTSGITGGSANIPIPVGENNQTWLTRVSRQVADTMAKSPSDVYAALQKWLDGMTITTSEKAIVDKAITIGMNPPEGTQGISPVTPDAPGSSPAVVYDKPFGNGAVIATSAGGAQWFMDYATGKRRPISLAENRALRAAGSNYQVQIVSPQALKAVPVK